MHRYLTWTIGLVSVLVLFLTITGAMAQGTGALEIPWWTVDGGGGAATGAGFAVHGTLGQPDAGVLRGDRFTLTGGFWGPLAPPSTKAILYLPAVMK